MKLFYTNLLFCVFIGSNFFRLTAQDRVFARTYQSNVIPKGSFDIEYFSLLSSGKKADQSPYILGRKLYNRIELEYGLGKNIQTAFYFNTSEFKFTPRDSGSQSVSGFKTSISNEWKWKLSDPVAHSFGSALYWELTAATDEIEFETKLMVDKRFN